MTVAQDLRRMTQRADKLAEQGNVEEALAHLRDARSLNDDCARGHQWRRWDRRITEREEKLSAPAPATSQEPV